MAKVLSRSNNNEMLKIEDTSNPKGYVWYSLTDKVKSFIVSQDIKGGDEVEFKSEVINGEETIVYINKAGGTTTTELKCEVCKAPLKTDKYKTCYTCSMELKKKEETSPEGVTRQTSIEKQAMMKASAEIIAGNAQPGTPPDLLADMTISIYEKLLARLIK